MQHIGSLLLGLMYVHIERLAILHISKFICTLEKRRRMLLFPESGPKKNFRIKGFTKTVTPHLRSIVPNVQHMAYFAHLAGSLMCVTGRRG